MSISRIEITNFKGISDRQIIELRPITLLFGPNSAGKSTILQALHYLREILERGNTNPDTLAGGSMDLGGFGTLVHNHDLDRTITLKAVMDLSLDQSCEGLPLHNEVTIDDPEFAELPILYLTSDSFDEYQGEECIRKIALAIDIQWSALKQASYVSRMEIELNDEPIASIVSPPDKGRAQLTDFNFSHPLLRQAVSPDDAPAEDMEQLPDSSPLEDEIRSLSRQVAADRITPDMTSDTLRIGVGTPIGALPTLDHELGLDIRDPDAVEQRFDFDTRLVHITKLLDIPELDIPDPDAVEERDILTGATWKNEQHTPRTNGLRRLLSEMILGPARIIRDYLAQMIYIGPLREVPARNYRPQFSPDNARWANGLAAWDFLYRDQSGDLMKEVNQWLENYLQTGYRLERVECKEVPVPSRFHRMFERGLDEDDLGELQEIYQSLAIRTEVVLRDSGKGILVAPCDVGIGISQMIPVIVGALRDQYHEGTLLAVEQPELHVHPAIQVGMGDLFIRAAQSTGQVAVAANRFRSMDDLFINTAQGGLVPVNDKDIIRPLPEKTLLIETHSEHIILRLLRRIRETTDNELPPGVSALRPDDLSVIYVEGGDSGVRFRALGVDDEGEFRDRWPHGFFEERAEELF